MGKKFIFELFNHIKKVRISHQIVQLIRLVNCDRTIVDLQSSKNSLQRETPENFACTENKNMF